MSIRSMKKSNLIHAALVARGSSLAQWARDNNYPMTTVWQALHGLRNGAKARGIRAELEKLTHA